MELVLHLSDIHMAEDCLNINNEANIIVNSVYLNYLQKKSMEAKKIVFLFILY